ncbi:hypothetical protein OY671_010809, partial [Metschnikowia pulcherrima]
SERGAEPPGTRQRETGRRQPAGPDGRRRQLRTAFGVAAAHAERLARGAAIRPGLARPATPGRSDRHAGRAVRHPARGMAAGRRAGRRTPAGNQPGPGPQRTGPDRARAGPGRPARERLDPPGNRRRQRLGAMARGPGAPVAGQRQAGGRQPRGPGRRRRDLRTAFGRAAA